MCLRTFVLALALLALVSTEAGAKKSGWWKPVSGIDGFELLIRQDKVQTIPTGDGDFSGGIAEEKIFAAAADHYNSPLFKELRRLQQDGKLVLYAKIEEQQHDLINWPGNQKLVAVLKNGSLVPAERVLACYRPSETLELPGGTSFTFGGGEILDIFPQETVKGPHPPFELSDIRMEVLVRGSDRSRFMVFVVMQAPFKSSEVDHWMVDSIAEQPAPLSGANQGGRP